jgi:hypothetical protein
MLLFKALFALSVGPVFAATCTLPATKTSLAASAGTWTGSGCTGGSFVPGNGDSAIIADTVTLTIANGETWDIGSSPATHGTSAIHMSDSGVVVVSTGATLRLRGPLTFTTTGVFDNTDYLVIQHGATVNLIAVAGSRYTTGPTAQLMGRLIRATGTLGSHIPFTVTPASGGTWQLGDQDTNFLAPGPGNFTYCDFSGLGSATVPGIELGTDYANLGFSLVNSTVTNSAGVDGGGHGFDSGNTFTVSGTVFSGTLTLYDWHVNANGVAPSVFLNSVFDRIIMGDGAGHTDQMDGISIQDCIIGDQFFPNYVSGNTYSLSKLAFVALNAAINNSLPSAANNIYWFPLHTIDNPHVFLPFINTTPVNITSVIFDDPFDRVADSGELFNNPPSQSSLKVLAFSGIIQVPTQTGQATSEWGSIVGNDFTFQMLHATSIGGGNTDFLQIDEGDGGASTSTYVMKVNLLYSKPSATTWFKAFTQSPLSPSTDRITADYNLGFNFTATDPGYCPTCTNQGNGYIYKFTSPPGVHDVAVNPYLSNAHMSLALYDTLYLRNSYPAWSSGGTYPLGTFVSLINVAKYGGLPIGLHCINSTGCNGSVVGAVPLTSYTFSSGITSIVVSGGVATVTTSSVLGLHTGDSFYLTSCFTASLCPLSSIQVTGVSGSTFTYATAASNGTYNSGTDPSLTMDTWQAFWEFSSVTRLSAEVSKGTTFTDASTGCNSPCSAITNLIGWIKRSNTPQQPSLYGVTFPGDTSPITNVGAVPMDKPLAFVPVTQ